MSTTTTAGSAPVSTPRGARVRGALAGLLAAAAGVLVGEAVSTLLPGVSAPVVSVGNRAIDWTPQPLKEWAIATFGAADKAVLIGGVLLSVAALAMLAGLLGARSLRVGLALITVLVGIASAAILTDRTASAGPLLRLLPIGAMALVGIGGFWWMVRALRPVVPLGSTTSPDTTTRSPATAATAATTTKATPSPTTTAPGRVRLLLTDDLTGERVPTGFDRRAFLQAAGAIAAVGAIGGATARLGGQGAATTSRAAISLPKPVVPLAPPPSGVTFEVPGLTPYLSRNADFYRVDTALQVPDVPLEAYTLRIHGMVDRPLELSFADLLARPLVERRITLTCVSNPVGGDLMGNATWLGIPMRELLAEAGLQEGADAVRSTSADNFTAGTPLSALTDEREALLAIGMNGEPLPLEHGFPVRMVTPGLYGYVSATKWLVDLEVTRFADFSAYWTDRGYAEQAPIKLSSRIDVPGSFAQLKAGPNVVAGVAWAQNRGIDKVEVRVDGGDWHEAQLAQEDSTNTWRPWRWEWPAEAGTQRLEVRASDRSGATQTSSRAPIAPDGSTGWHSVTVTVS